MRNLGSRSHRSPVLIPILLFLAILFIVSPFVRNASGFFPSQTPTLKFKQTSGSISHPAYILFSSGNLWASTSAGIKKFTPQSGGAITSNENPSVTVSAPCNPQGIAFDSSGDLWVANAAGSGGCVNSLEEFTPPISSSSSAAVTVTHSLNLPNPSGSTYGSLSEGIAFDNSGNLWVANTGASNIEKFSSPITSSSHSSLNLTLHSGFTHPTSVAFDASGNLWVSDPGNSAVYEFSASKLSNCSGPTCSLYPSALVSFASVSNSNINSVTFDASGDLWVADFGGGSNNGAANEIIPPFSNSSAIALTVGGSTNILKNPLSTVFDDFGTLWAADSGNSDLAEFASLLLGPNQGNAGSTIQIYGTGLATNTLYYYCFNSGVTSPSSACATTHSFTSTKSGAIPTGTSLLIPSGSATGSLEVSTSSAVVAAATFTVSPTTFSLSPTSGYVGTNVTLTGSNFAHSHSITISYRGLQVTTHPSTCSTDSGGGFTCSFLAPESMEGANPVTVYDGTTTVDNFFIVSTSITLSPSTAPNSPSPTVTVTGHTFAPSSTATIKYGGTSEATTPSTCFTGAIGTTIIGKFSCTITPTTSIGTFTVNATDGINWATATFTATGSGTSTTSLSCSPSPVDENFATTCTATVSVSGASATGSVDWSTSGSGVFSAATCTLSSESCQVTYTPSIIASPVTITGAYQGDINYKGSSNTFSLSIDSVLSAGSISPSSPTIDHGQAVTVTANPSGGSGSNTYQWYTSADCSSSPVTGATASTYNASPTATTTYYVKITDSSGASACSSGDTVTVDSALTAGSVTPSSPTIDNGQSVTLSTHASGGTGSYSFQWYSGSSSTCSSDTAIGGATSSTYSASPTVNTDYCYTVTDTSTSPPTVYSPTDLVTVDPTLTAGVVTPASPTIDNGQSVTLVANPSGGTGSYAYQWYSGASSSCSSDTAVLGATSSTYSPSPTSNTYYCYSVSDTSVNTPTVTSATDQVAVDSALGADAVTPSSPTIDNGQSVTLAAHPSGGTGSYTYQWYSGSSSTCSSDTVIAGATSSTYNASPTTNTYYCYAASDSSMNPPTATSSTDLVTVDAALSAGGVTPDSPTIDNGQSLTLTAHPSGGTGSYTFQWYSGSSSTCASDTAVPGATSSTYSPSPGSNNDYCYSVTDTSTNAPTVSSSTDLVTVDVVPSAGAITPSSPTIGSGGSVTLTAHPSGGTGSYSYQWYSGSSSTCASDTAINGATSSTYLASPGSSTYFCYSVTDTSTNPPTVISSTDLVTVTTNGPTSVTLSSFSTNPMDVSMSDSISVSWSGGTSTFTVTLYYSSSSSACSSSDTIAAPPVAGVASSPQTITFTTPATPGTYYFCASVTDSGSVTGSSSPSGPSLTVDSALSPGSISPSSPIIDVGRSVTLTANPSGGSGSDTYQWYTSADCSTTPVGGATSSTYDASPASTITYYTKIIDSSGASVCSSGDTVTVDPALSSGSATPSSPTIDDGQSITLTANPSGGTGTYTYQWYSGSSSTCSSDSPIGGATSSTYAASPSSTTEYCYTVTDSSTNAPTLYSATDHLTVDLALTAGAVTPSNPTIDSGQSVSLTSQASGGTGSYSYQWYSGPSATCSSDSAISGASSSAYVASPGTSTYYCYTVTDTSTNAPTVYSATDLVAVDGALSAGLITPSSPTIDNGQPVTLSANPSGGTGTYSYQWYAGSSATCSSDTAIIGATSSAYVASTATVTYYCYTVTDSSTNPPTATSSSDLVTVDPALSAGGVTPASPTIDNGQSLTLTAHPSGGTGSYTYQWYSGGSSTCSADSAVSGATSSTYSPSPTSNTNYCYSVTDSSTNAPTVSSATDLVTVDATLSAGAVTPSSPTIDGGQSVTLTAHASGGTGSYSYQWYSGSSSTCISDTAIVGATSSTYLASPTSNKYYCYSVIDASTSASAVYSGSDLLTVNPDLVPPTVSSSPGSITTGQSSVLGSTAVTTGTSPYVYRWFEEAPGTSTFIPVSGASSSSYTFHTDASTTTGTWSFILEVTDSIGASVNSAPVTLVVVSPPVSSVAQPISLTAAGSGAGSPTFTISSCSAFPTSISGNGASHLVSVAPSCAFIISIANSGSTRYGFAAGGSLTTSMNETANCTSGTCVPISIVYYAQFMATFEVTANAQPTFDSGLSPMGVVASQLGSSSTVCTISFAGAGSMASCSGWVDAGASFSLSPATLGGAPAGSRWVLGGSGSGVTSAATYTIPAYKQYSQTTYYEVTCASGANCSVPSLTYASTGSTSTIALTELAPGTQFWVDAGTQVAIGTITDSTGGIYHAVPSSWTMNAAGAISDPVLFYAQAITTVTMSPSSGPVGTLIYLTGAGFAPSNTYNYCFEPEVTPGNDTACAPTYQFTSTQGGAIPPLTDLTAYGQTGLVLVSEAATGQVVTDARFVVTQPAGSTPPSITLDPTSGPTGTSVNITGTGFTPGATVSVAISRGVVATGTVRGDGTLRLSLSVPSSPDGAASVSVTGSDVSTNPNDVAAATFLVSNVAHYHSSVIPVNATSGPIVLNQTSNTGITVTMDGLNGKPGLASLRIEVANLTSLSFGVSNPEIAGTVRYYDVFVVGNGTIPSGLTAQVCITNPIVGSGSPMEYWNGGSWVVPGGVAIRGDTICGFIPVLGLGGTNFVVGSAHPTVVTTTATTTSLTTTTTAMIATPIVSFIPLWPILLLVLIAGFFFLIAWKRRRRDEEEETARKAKRPNGQDSINSTHS